MLTETVCDARAWTRASLSESDWRCELSASTGKQIESLCADRALAKTSPLVQRLMNQVKEVLTRGAGLVLIDRLPSTLSAPEMLWAYRLIGNALCPRVATKWDGTMFYEVKDTGRRFGAGVRGSATNVELTFHTDNAFGVALPDFVGLLCQQPAAAGGISRFCSLYTVHNTMLREAPTLLRRLYEPMYYDRQAEHAADAPPVLVAPLFRYRQGVLSARLTPNLVFRGYELMRETMDDELREALRVLCVVVADESLWAQFRMERGQIQFLNNHWCAHFRSAFQDDAGEGTRRLLVRSWHRAWGSGDYDG